jgi:hypothetical protein
MTKYLVFFLKYYPNCVSILYKKCCRVVFLTKRTFFTIVFFANVSDFVLCPRVTFFPFFTNVQCYIIKKLTDLLYGKISNLGLTVLTSLSLSQYSKTSVGYFPILPSLSVSKLLLFNIFTFDSAVRYYACICTYFFAVTKNYLAVTFGSCNSLSNWA